MGSRRMENEEKEEPIGLLLRGERCDTPLWFSRRMENEVRRGEKFSENGPFFTSGGKVRVSILREWTLRRSSS